MELSWELNGLLASYFWKAFLFCKKIIVGAKKLGLRAVVNSCYYSVWVVLG